MLNIQITNLYFTDSFIFRNKLTLNDLESENFGIQITGLSENVTNQVPLVVIPDISNDLVRFHNV